jgi:hypothetical protein
MTHTRASSARCWLVVGRARRTRAIIKGLEHVRRPAGIHHIARCLKGCFKARGSTDGVRREWRGGLSRRRRLMTLMSTLRERWKAYCWVWLCRSRRPVAPQASAYKWSVGRGVRVLKRLKADGKNAHASTIHPLPGSSARKCVARPTVCDAWPKLSAPIGIWGYWISGHRVQSRMGSPSLSHCLGTVDREGLTCYEALGVEGTSRPSSTPCLSHGPSSHGSADGARCFLMMTAEPLCHTFGLIRCSREWYTHGKPAGASRPLRVGPWHLARCCVARERRWHSHTCDPPPLPLPGIGWVLVPWADAAVEA